MLELLQRPDRVPVKVKCLQMSLLLNCVVVLLPGGLGIKEEMSAERAECLGKTPQVSTHRLACSHVSFRASEMEKNTNCLNGVEKVSWQWGQRN